jgi:hypothetical protein
MLGLPPELEQSFRVELRATDHARTVDEALSVLL